MPVSCHNHECVVLRLQHTRELRVVLLSLSAWGSSVAGPKFEVVAISHVVREGRIIKGLLNQLLQPACLLKVPKRSEDVRYEFVLTAFPQHATIVAISTEQLHVHRHYNPHGLPKNKSPLIGPQDATLTWVTCQREAGVTGSHHETMQHEPAVQYALEARNASSAYWTAGSCCNVAERREGEFILDLFGPLPDLGETRLFEGLVEESFDDPAFSNDMANG